MDNTLLLIGGGLALLLIAKKRAFVPMSDGGDITDYSDPSIQVGANLGINPAIDHRIGSGSNAHPMGGTNDETIGGANGAADTSQGETAGAQANTGAIPPSMVPGTTIVGSAYNAAPIKSTASNYRQDGGSRVSRGKLRQLGEE